MTVEFSCTVTQERTRAVVAVVGELDLHTADEFRQVLLDTLPVVRELVVDLAGLGFIDSSGLSALVAGHKRAVQCDSRLLLGNVPPLLVRMLAVTGLSELFPVRSVQGAAGPVGQAADPLGTPG